MQKSNSKSPPSKLPTISRIPLHGQIKYANRQKKQIKLPKQYKSPMGQNSHKKIVSKENYRRRNQTEGSCLIQDINNIHDFGRQIQTEISYNLNKEYQHNKNSASSLNYLGDRKIIAHNSKIKPSYNLQNKQNSKYKIKKNDSLSKEDSARYLQKKQSNVINSFNQRHSLFSKNLPINQILHKAIAKQQAKFDHRQRNYSLGYNKMIESNENYSIQQKQKHRRKISSHRNRIKTDNKKYNENNSRGSMYKKNKKNFLQNSEELQKSEQQKNIVRQISSLNKQYLKIKYSQDHQEQLQSYRNLENMEKYSIKNKSYQCSGRLQQDPDKTLQDFQRCVKINQQFIHKEINKNLMMKNNRNSIVSISEKRQVCKDFMKNKKNNNIISSKKYDNYSNIDDSLPPGNSLGNRSIKNASSKKIEVKSALNRDENRRKSKSQIKKTQGNLSSEQSTAFDASYQQQIFSQINKVLQHKSMKSPITQNKISITKTYQQNPNQPHFHLHRLKQSKKIQKLAQKIRQMSPNKSICEIKQQISQQLAREFGLPTNKSHNQQIKSQSRTRNLKDQNNYHQWRRIDISGSKQRSVEYRTGSLKDSFDFDSYSHKKSLKTQVTYKVSTYQMQNQRLSDFIMKNQITLQNYLRSKKQLLSLKMDPQI